MSHSYYDPVRNIMPDAYYDPVREIWVRRIPVQGNPRPGYSVSQFQINDPDPRPNKIGGWYFRGEIGRERETNGMDRYVQGANRSWNGIYRLSLNYIT
jgi:hypothetical protein